MLEDRIHKLSRIHTHPVLTLLSADLYCSVSDVCFWVLNLARFEVGPCSVFEISRFGLGHCSVSAGECSVFEVSRYGSDGAGVGGEWREGKFRQGIE